MSYVCKYETIAILQDQCSMQKRVI